LVLILIRLRIRLLRRAIRLHIITVCLIVLRHFDLLNGLIQMQSKVRGSSPPPRNITVTASAVFADNKFMTTWHAIILAFVEGLTEYLPISSTGHIILTSAWFGIATDEFVKNFTVIVQFGAILSVLVVYWRRFFQSLEFYKKLFVAFLPAAMIGLAVKNKIDALLDSVSVVAWAFILGGIVLIWIEKKSSAQPSPQTTDTNRVTYRQAALIGLAQCCAFIPGVSRSAASIVGGLLLGLDRKTAAEFSFFLAVPTLAGATFLKVLKIAPTLDHSHVGLILIGNVISFLVGWAAIKSFIALLTRYGFKYFGWYRIALGILLLALTVR
jgi:undecaprenyl-diphosphatase